MSDDERIIEQIVKKHGEVINVREQPHVLIDILRRFGPAVSYDDGGLPGGVPTPPPPPPGPSSMPFNPLASEPGTPGGPDGGTGPSGPSSAPMSGAVRVDDVMKEVLRLSRSVDELHAKIDRQLPGTAS